MADLAHRPPTAGGPAVPRPELIHAMVAIRPGGLTWRRTFLGRPDQAPRARQFVRFLLDDSPCREDAELVVSELVSNALRHTASGRSTVPSSSRSSARPRPSASPSTTVAGVERPEPGGNDVRPGTRRAAGVSWPWRLWPPRSGIEAPRPSATWCGHSSTSHDRDTVRRPALRSFPRWSFSYGAPRRTIPYGSLQPHTEHRAAGEKATTVARRTAGTRAAEVGGCSGRLEKSPQPSRPRRPEA